MNKYSDFVLRTITSILTLLAGLLSWISWSEWYAVKVKGEILGYPFGGEGPTPYYYKTADLYANVNLTWGVVFLFAFLFSVFALIKRRDKLVLISSVFTLLLLLVFYIHGKL